jgi:hypothetical protein
MKLTIRDNQHLNLVQCYTNIFLSLKQVIMQLFASAILISSLLAVSYAVCIHVPILMTLIDLPRLQRTNLL